jgi:glycosyltransferase involved in cell wall biosynthesis
MKISVVTVCYNSAAYIADALQSVEHQSWPDLEHIVVDGGSTDGTLEIVNSFAQPWRRVVSEKDGGIYEAMNKGIGMCRGDVVGFINSDDFFATPEALKMVAGVFSDSTIDVCYGDLCYVNQHDTTRIVRSWKSSAFTPGMFLRGWCPAHPTFYVRRQVYERLGVFDLRYRIAADVELMARFMEVNHVASQYIPEVLVHMRMGGTTNRTWRNVLTQNREIWLAFKRHELRPSLMMFALGKLWSRSWQFLRGAA